MHARAAEASARASESAGAADEAAERAIESGDEEPDPSGPSAELRDLFRQAAKQFHPDLAGDDAERARRTKLMAALNSAYQAGDADAIRRMLAGEAARPEAIKGDDVGSRIVRVFRKLAQIRARFTELVHFTPRSTPTHSSPCSARCAINGRRVPTRSLRTRPTCGRRSFRIRPDSRRW